MRRRALLISLTLIAALSVGLYWFSGTDACRNLLYEERRQNFYGYEFVTYEKRCSWLPGKDTLTSVGRCAFCKAPGERSHRCMNDMGLPQDAIDCTCPGPHGG